MDKDAILEERMKECGITKEKILEKINLSVDDKYAVLVYISHLEGLGNKNSDFDIYVFSERELENTDVMMLRMNNAVCDIEFWTYNCVNKMVKSETLNNDYITLKLLKRIELGVIIHDGSEKTKMMKNELSELNLDIMIKNYFKSLANEEYDDAVKMYKGGRLECCLTCIRRSCDYAIAALNAKMGHANLNLKWAPKILMDNNGYDMDEILDGYLRYQVYSNLTEDNIESFLDEYFDYLTETLALISISEESAR